MSEIEQIYTKCLAQGSYFIESNGEAAVIDPLREPEPYLRRAAERGVKIKYIFETHFHADFVSGHLDLAQKTGATIVYGPTADTTFEKHTAKDGEIFKVGDLQFKALHTPGHTPESTTFLLRNEKGEDHAIFTGDTLFIGDVGRPDLAQKATNLTEQDLAGMLYQSLRSKIMPLSDSVIVYPAHGAGSACGKNMSAETWDTLGNQKQTNYALRADMTKEEFIKEVTDGLSAPPQYFADNVRMNQEGYESLDSVMDSGLTAIAPADFKQYIDKPEVLILDVRDKNAFVKGFIPNSIFIGLDGSFAPWVGAVVTDIHQPIVLVTPPGREEEAVRRLARVGYDNTLGFLEGGYEAWKNADLPIKQIETKQMKDFVLKEITEVPSVVDVRKPNEYDATHYSRSTNVPLDEFPNKVFSKLDKTQQHHVHCKSGYRSTIASSLLVKEGFEHIVNVIGSVDLIKNSGCPVSGSCPSLAAHS
jgi:glyoxylase-like metal-dependent hydrolase (beta-lactamase superfamily II)/rhodanese-related sulfurtransferase